MLSLRVRCISGIVNSPKCFWSRTQGSIQRSISDSSENAPPDHFDPKLLPNLKRLIKHSGYSLKDGHTSIRTECPVCPVDAGTTRATVYLNKTTGAFLCPRCQHSEPWTHISKFYDKFYAAKNGEEVERLRKNFLCSKKQTVEYTSQDINKLVPTSEMSSLDWESFGIRIPTEQLSAMGVKWNPADKRLHFDLLDSQGCVVGEKILSGDTLEEDTLPTSGCAGLLIHSPSISKESNKAVLVLSVVDFLALVSQKFDGVTIICLPYKLKALPPECLPGLESYKELTLWFDFDTTGWDIARNFSKKLDEKRCRFIRPTNNQPTPYAAMKQGLNLSTIFQNALPILHKSITTFSSLKQDVLSELQNIEKVHGVKWKRFPTLNKLLKGHRKGELTVLTGPTGCGKTTFMSEYSLDLATQGVTTLWGSFEIRNTRLASTLLRQYVGYSLEDKLEEFEQWAGQLEKLPIYFMTFHGQQSIKVVMEAIEHAQYVHDIQHVIIDNVQFMMGIHTAASKASDKFWEQDVIIASFRMFATKRNVHVTLVMHPRKERESEDLTTSSIFGSAKATQEADNVLIIQDRRLTSVRGKKFLQVAKNRYSGDLGIMPLEFDKDGLSYSKKRKEKDKEQG